MEESEGTGELDYPKTLLALTDFVDALPPTRDVLIRTRLGHAKAAADSAGDAQLINAIAAEGNAYLFFGDTDSLVAAVGEIHRYFNDAMVEYLRARRDVTPQPRLRARYAHVIAAYAPRHDEGLRAVDAYAAAVDYHRDREGKEPTESLYALDKLVPLMIAVARRYKARNCVLPTLVACVQTANPYLRKSILELIIGDPAITPHVLRPLRDDALRTLRDLRGAMELADIQAMGDLGIRLDARLGTTDRAPWLRALADVYRAVINSAAHPLMKEQAAQRAALVFQELGDTAGRAEMITLQREYAGKGLEYHSFSQPIDESGEMAKSVRNALDEAFEKGGALRVLGCLALSPDIMPKLEHARHSLDEMTEQGMGVFDQLSTTIAHAGDRRVVAHGDPGEENQERSLWDQFGCDWVLTTYIMAVAAQAMISNGSVTVEHLLAFIRQTWIGAKEDDQPNDLVALLAAPLRTYVGLITNQQHDDALVVTIDSLALRFEAVFRKLARRLREPDWMQRKDEKGRPYTEVAGLGIIDNERVATYLGENLHAFATYTLARHDEGLRDKIAHAATHASDYAMQNAHALVFLLLRLAMRQGDLGQAHASMADNG